MDTQTTKLECTARYRKCRIGLTAWSKPACRPSEGVWLQAWKNRFAQQQCCCETNRNIDAVRAENYKNACEIKTAIHEEAERTRGLMMANQLQELRDKLADRDRALQSANFNLSQVVQNATIVGQLKPYPTPAYIVNSPYQSSTGGATTTT